MEQPEAGMHLARCIKVIDIGTQSDEFQGRIKHQRKIWLQFELIGTQMSGEYNADLKGKPFAMSLTYTLSLSDRASLKKTLEAWRGRPFTPSELSGFDVATIAGAAAYLNVGPNKDGDRMRINSINPVPAPMKSKIPKAKNPIVTLSLDPETFDRAVYDALTDKMREWIAGSPEFSNVMKSEATDHDIPGEMPPGMNEGDEGEPF